MSLIFLSSGLFLGWSLGANDAANVFGTAVGTKMIRFKTAALISSIFVLLGAVISGTGTTKTLGSLGTVNAIAGSFMVAAAAAFTVFWMSRLKIPVSTSQAIVGAIIGWNFFTDSPTDHQILTKIVTTWILCPILSATFAALLFIAFRAFFKKAKIHLLRLDLYVRLGLIIVGAFGAYSLGANNIANVVGVFVSVSPFKDFNFLGLLPLSGTQLLFSLGGIAIAVGVYTYSEKVMQTVGRSLFRLSPEAALVVVLANALVLFLFASQRLEQWLLSHGLPTFPLVPVSSTQAVIGAIIGIGMIKGAKGINYGLLGEIAAGWAVTPIVAGVITFIGLFFLQNVFNQELSYNTALIISEPGVASFSWWWRMLIVLVM
jgi:PiT family inorganic phosphate transporter